MKFDVIVGDSLLALRETGNCRYKACQLMRNANIRLLTEDFYIMQIATIIKQIERGVSTMSDLEKLLVIVSKQLLVVSNKIDTLSEKMEHMDLSIDAEEIAESIVEYMKDSRETDETGKYDELFELFKNVPGMITP